MIAAFFELGGALVRVGLMSSDDRLFEAPGSGRLNHPARFATLVGRQVVHHHDVAGLQRRRQHMADIGVKCIAVHRPVDHHRRGHAVQTQGADGSGGFPMMGWTPPRRHHCAKVVRCQSLTGGVRDGSYNNRRGFGQECVPGARGERLGNSCVPQEASARQDAVLLRGPISLCGGDGSVRECPLLGARTRTARPSGAANRPCLRQTVRQAAEEGRRTAPSTGRVADPNTPASKPMVDLIPRSSRSLTPNS